MQVAFIPPRGMTSYANRGDILMCLAPQFADAEYTETMQRLSQQLFTILDNGVNESVQLNNGTLAIIAKQVETREIVLPDVLGDSHATYRAAAGYIEEQASPAYKYMGVVQGQSQEDLRKLIDRYAQVSKITTLGLPRLLLGISQSIRIDMATWADDAYPKRFAYHFLGASSIWPKEPYYATKYAPHVRSIDTSLPFNYGLAGVQLDKASQTGQRINRPTDYFTKWHKATSLTTIHHNLIIYKEWCSGKTSPSSQLY